MKRKIKLFDPYFDDSEKNAILKTLNSHFWASGNGVGNVKEFETLFKKYVKADLFVCHATKSSSASRLFSVKKLEGSPDTGFPSSSLRI